MQLEQPVLEITPAVVSTNLDTYKAKLREYTEQYQLVVTEDNIADAKKAAAELNKIGKEIKVLVKQKTDLMKAPINQISADTKELLLIIDDSYRAIYNQVEVYEDKTRQVARELLTKWLAECREDYRIRQDFYSAFDVETEVKLTALNAKRDSLTKAARDKIESVVSNERGMQQQTDLRLSELKVKSQEAGLDAPIEQRHVEPFLFADHDTYENNLSAILEAELERQKVAEKRRAEQQAQREQQIKDRAEREARERMDREQAEQRKREEQVIEPDYPLVNEDAKERAANIFKPAVPDGKKVVSVLVRFDVTVPAHVNPELVSDKVKSELESLGKNPASVELL